MSPCITPLHLSNCRGTPEDARQLDEVLKLDPGALHRLQHSLNFEFATPVMCAAEAGHAECLTLLVERGADVLAQDREGRRPMFYAVRAGSAACVDLLASHGASIDFEERNTGNRTTRYLEVAAQAGHGEVMRVLLERGASFCPQQQPSPSGTQQTHESLVSIAITEGHASCLKWLLVYGAHILDPKFRGDVLQMVVSPDLGKTTIEAREEMLSVLFSLGYNMKSVNQLAHTHARLKTKAKVLLRTPRTLQSACRVVLRHALGGRYYTRNLKELRVPPYHRSVIESRLNKFLHFYDV